jgi:hypothetical protein
LTEQPGRRHAGNAGADDRYTFPGCKIAVHVTPFAPLRRLRFTARVPSIGAVTFDRGPWITGEFLSD